MAKKPFSRYQQKLSFSDTAINTWAERGDGYVILENKHTGKTLLEWRGADAINQAVEDGFLPFGPDSRGRGDTQLHNAAWDYYQSLRRNPGRRRKGRRNPGLNASRLAAHERAAMDEALYALNKKHVIIANRGTWKARTEHSPRNGWRIWLEPTQSAKNTADYQASKRKLKDDFIIDITNDDDWPPRLVKLFTKILDRAFARYHKAG